VCYTLNMMSTELRQTDCDRCRCVDEYLNQSDDELLCDLCQHEKHRDAEEYQRTHQLFPFNPASLNEAELVRCADEWRL